MGNICARPLPENEQYQQPEQLASHKFADYGIYLDYGDIKNEEVDVIVVQTNLQLEVMNCGNKKLPKSLLAGVCQSTQQQLSKDVQILRDKQNYIHGDVVYSHAAELEFDFVFYCILPSDGDLPKLFKKDHLPQFNKSTTQKYQKQFIYDCITKCLKLAEELEITSLCFPAMSSSKQAVQTVAAMEMLAVKNYLEDCLGKSRFLNSIHFCVEDEKEIESFQWAFDKVFLDNDDNSDASDDESIKDSQKKKTKKYEDENYLESFGANYYDKWDSLERKLSI